ncbi:hypothetical protein HU830_07940 [Lactobacillus sp. DCY120]|uniref:Uncharacterized protein n=1 Tax=Bombilactobacillus apium TaxID=2675299 RepID=A0A850R508_9LACO|nr:hypothetical protein [Bombilactobacillus apium]NVY97051.1 hypothetical protein [Bombilactobacillus apium]
MINLISVILTVIFIIWLIWTVFGEGIKWLVMIVSYIIALPFVIIAAIVKAIKVR